MWNRLCEQSSGSPFNFPNQLERQAGKINKHWSDNNNNKKANSISKDK